MSLMPVDFFPKFDIKLDILTKDDNFLIVDKPAGLLVHPVKYSSDKTLVDLLLKHYPEIKGVGQSGRWGIVHRLDRDVSGLMVVARTEKMYQVLIEQFKQGKIKKEYLALVHGRPLEKRGIIDIPLARTRKGKIVAVEYRKKIKDEKPAFTKYKTKKQFKDFTLLQARPATGRTHQIRVHLKSINCPIVGDRRYSIKQLNNLTTKQKLDRIFLHACYLGFYDLNNRWQEFRKGLPKELNDFLKKLKNNQ
ncbi:RNA pseudouridine synthase [Patescibacteria group bacterium]|nr:RNA pseudouridine synthase [Patescibacteria group bacterium]